MLHTVLLPLLWIAIAQAPAQPSAAAALAQPTSQDSYQQRLLKTEVELAHYEDRLKILEGSLDQAEREITRLSLSFGLALGAILFLGTGAFVFAFRWLKATARQIVLEHTSTILEQRLSAVAELELRKLDKSFSDLLTLIVYASRGDHDGAVRAVWDHRAETLNAYPGTVQRELIRSIALGEVSSSEDREIADRAAQQLFEAEKTEDTLSLLYALAAATDNWSAGYKSYQRYQETIPVRSDPDGVTALLRILRRMGKFQEALKVIREYKGARRLEVVQIIGHIVTNTGHFEEAHQHLEPWVSTITRDRWNLPKGWERIIYSYLLNCIQWGKPELGIDAARFATEIGVDPLLQLGALRLALALERKGRPEATPIMEQVRVNLERLKDDSTVLQGKARLLARAQGPAKAVVFLRSHEGEFETEAGSRERASLPVYFYHCLIGELLIDAKSYAEAREKLLPWSLEDRLEGKPGEASFLIARAYAAEGGHDLEAANYLDRAGKIHRRWCRVAELHSEVRAAHERIGRKLCSEVPEIPLPTGAK